MSKQETRPFNLEHAKAGAPYACRNGDPATILKWDGRDRNFPLIGCHGRDDASDEWCANGRHNSLLREEHHWDLVMTPLGYIEGKPVFWDSEVQTKASGVLRACHLNGLSLVYCSWPAPPLKQTAAPSARDKAIAKAVRHQCLLAAQQAISQIDLAAIIASVEADK